MSNPLAIRLFKTRIALVLAIGGALLAPATRASTIAVTDFVDDANVANGTCTLREAIRAANTDVAVDACPAGQSAFVDEILVPPGVHIVNLSSGNDEDLSVTGDLDLRGAVRIRGAGSEFSIIDGSGPGATDRLLQIHDLADDVVIERVALRGGNAVDTSKLGGVLWNLETGPNDVELIEVEISGGVAASGGGIFNAGDLNIQRSQIFDNQATVVPGTVGNDGGGIASSGPSAQLRIEDSEIRGNTAEADGAGLWIGAGPFVLYRSHVNDNVAGNSGGGLHVASNGYDVQYVEFARNRAAAGGGVYLAEQGEVQRSAFIANQATVTGGGVHDAFGGFVRFSTLAQNSAPLGAAVYADTAQTLLDSDTIAGNSGGGVHNQGGVFFENTLLSGNTGGNCTGSPPAFGAFNLDSANSCGFVSTPAAPNLPNTQPLLGPLADNGGPTKTLALLPGSPAVDFVTSEIRTNCQNMFDQRGYPRGRPRTQNGLGQDVFLCDLGAYEATAPFVVNTLTDGVDADLADDLCATSGSVCTLRAAIQQANAIVGLNEISLGAGTHLLSIAGTGEDAGVSGDFDIVPPAVIRGAGVGLSTVDGAGVDRVFHVGPPGMGAAPSWTFFRDFSITGGDAGTDNGGGFATRSPLRIERVRLANNDGQLGSAISTSPTGFFFLSDYAPVEILDSTLENNPGGGAVFIKDAVVERSSLIENVANSGSGGAGEFSRVHLLNSTVSGNEAAAQGAFFANAAVIDNSTIYDNTAGSDPGGVFLLELSVFRNSIIAENRAGGVLHNCSINAGAITSLGYNLTDGNGLDCLLDDATDQANVNPLLVALANNGGPTRTHLPMTGSPAIDRGDPTACPPTDQRGIPRPLDGDMNGSFICDVGSVELPEPRMPAQLMAGGLALAALARSRKGRAASPRQKRLCDG